MAASRGIPIELLYTLTAGKAPDPGSLVPGEVALELASDPVKMWVGVPSLIDADEQKLVVGDLVSMPEPAVNGAYLRQKDGSAYAWENRVANGMGSEIPILDFTVEAGCDAPALAINAFPEWRETAGASFGMFADDRWASEAFMGSALWVFARGGGVGLYVDNVGTNGGIVVETGGNESRGLEVVRHANAGSSIRLSHQMLYGDVTPSAYMLGDIAFAGTPADAWNRANGALICGVSSEQWNAAAHGTRLEFWTTPNGTATPQRTLTIDHNGVLNLTGTGAAYHVNGVPLALGGDGATQPGGTNLQVQYNNNGTAFAGASGVTIAPNTNSLTVSGTLTADTIAASGNITNFFTADTKRMTLRRGLMVGSAAFCDDWSENDEGVGSIHVEGLVQISEYFVNPISRAGIALKSWNNSSEISAQRFVGTPDTMWDLEVPVNTEIFRITGYGYAPYSQYMAATIGLGISDVAGQGILAFYTSEGGVTYRRVTIEKGLVISDHIGTTLADMGAGTVNVSHGFYIEGQDLIDVLTAIFDARYAPI